MTERTPAQKMFMKPGMRVALLHVPDGLEDALGIVDGAIPVETPNEADFVLDFATSQAEGESRIRALKPHIGDKTLAWIAYPKGSKAAGYDISRDTVFAYAQTIGLVAVANIAIDDTWSALRIRRT